MPLSLSACLSGISLAPISLKPESWCGGLRPCHPSSGPAGGSNRVIMPPHLSPLFVLPVLCLLYSLPHLELYLHAPSFSLNRELPSDASTPSSTPPAPLLGLLHHFPCPGIWDSDKNPSASGTPCASLSHLCLNDIRETRAVLQDQELVTGDAVL